MRISTRFELPTVSIQKGRWISSVISSTEDAVEDREERLDARRRQVAVRLDRDLQAELVAGDADDLAIVRILRIGLDDLDDRGDVTGDRKRQPLRYHLPVALHENGGDDGLQEHHRNDDDQQRARVKSGRQTAGAASGRSSASPAQKCGLPAASCRSSPSAPVPNLEFSRCSACIRCRARSAARPDWRDRPRSYASAD